MNDALRRFVACRSLASWLAICVSAMILVLVLDDLPAERQGWNYLSARGLPAGTILAAMALAWVRNSTFWAWVLIAGFGGAWLHRSAVRAQPAGRAEEKAEHGTRS